MKRTVLVAGASRGIGAAVCRKLDDAGHQIIGVSRFGTKAEGIDTEPANPQANLPSTVDTYSVDLSDFESVEKLVSKIENKYSIDTLICNAGYGRFGSLEEFSGKQIQQLLNTNLLSHMMLCRYLLPSLKKAGRSDIVFIGSESALQGGRFGAVYSATKAGLRGFAQALRYECAKANCHIGIVNPGMTRTAFFDELNFEPGPETNHAIDDVTVAEAVTTLLSAPDNSVFDEINISPLQKVVSKKPAN